MTASSIILEETFFMQFSWLASDANERINFATEIDKTVELTISAADRIRNQIPECRIKLPRDTSLKTGSRTVVS
jgi:hypothetical protein